MPRLRTPQTQRTVFLSVHEGHRDKICDKVSGAMLDACLNCDPMCEVACETCVKDNVVMVAGLAEEKTTGSKARRDFGW